jgi:type IV pilus assembly protein PilC
VAVLRFLRQLAIKLKAGLSLDKCLAALCTETRHAGVRQACVAIRAKTAGGTALADAMREHGQLFDVCVTGLVERGEKTRKLLGMLGSACDYLETRRRLEDGLRSAIFRPLNALSLVLLATFIATVALSFLAREFLPVSTLTQPASHSSAEQLAALVARKVQIAWPYVGVFGFVCFLALQFLPRLAPTRRVLDAIGVRLPLVGAAVRSTGVALFVRTLAIRTQVGATLAQAMTIAALTAQNQPMRERITTLIHRIEKGRPYIDALVEDGTLRLGDVTAVQAADRRGDLATVLLTLARDREQEATADVKALKAVTHTVVVVLLGVAIMGVVLTLYVPVFINH